MAVHIKCDILICGGGLAGLSLLYRAMKSGIWTGKKIVVIDRLEKGNNDRTWSFWKKDPSCFDSLISQQWKNLSFYSHEGRHISLDSGGYTYNSIRSSDFYAHVHAYLREFPQISFVQTEIISLSTSENECILLSNDQVYIAQYAFNSVYSTPAPVPGKQYFLQHFKGLRIKTKAAIPPRDNAWLMDFRTGQENGSTFFYTLPMAADEIFVEYTLFSKAVLPMEVYDTQIRKYIAEVLKIEDYEVIEEEFGVIPMTDHDFKRADGNIIHIGTAGGDTRASTGYTFTNTQKTIGKILHSLATAGHPFISTETIGLKQKLYDSTLLNVLDQGEYQGHQIFADLFSKAPAHEIFAFLDAESTIIQDLSIMKSLRILPFLKSFTAVAIRKLEQAISP